MMRSLYSGVAGLRTHQTKMDVLGNNIANVNTTSYKSQSITFSDLMYQTTQTASGASETKGGVNARQIGLGAKSGAISTAIESQGATQTTNNPFDIMITGSSFFIVNNGKENLYTRDGSFYVDGAGNLAMQSNGYFVQGWAAKEDKKTGEIKVDKNGDITSLQIMSADNATYSPASTTAALYSGNIDDHDTNVTSDDGKTITLEFYDNKGYLYTGKFTLKDTGTDHLFSLQLTDILDSDGNSINQELTLPDGTKTNRLDHVTFGKTETFPTTVTKDYEVNVDSATGVASISLKAGSEAFKDVPSQGATLATLMTTATGAGKNVANEVYHISDDDINNKYGKDTVYTIDDNGVLTFDYTVEDIKKADGTYKTSAYKFVRSNGSSYFADSATNTAYKEPDASGDVSTLGSNYLQNIFDISLTDADVADKYTYTYADGKITIYDVLSLTTGNVSALTPQDKNHFSGLQTAIDNYNIAGGQITTYKYEDNTLSVYHTITSTAPADIEPTLASGYDYDALATALGGDTVTVDVTDTTSAFAALVADTSGSPESLAAQYIQGLIDNLTDAQGQDISADVTEFTLTDLTGTPGITVSYNKSTTSDPELWQTFNLSPAVPETSFDNTKYEQTVISNIFKPLVSGTENIDTYGQCYYFENTTMNLSDIPTAMLNAVYTSDPGGNATIRDFLNDPTKYDPSKTYKVMVGTDGAISISHVQTANDGQGYTSDKYNAVIDSKTGLVNFETLDNIEKWALSPLEGNISDLLETASGQYAGLLKAVYGIDDDDARAYGSDGKYKIDTNTSEMTLTTGTHTILLKFDAANGSLVSANDNSSGMGLVDMIFDQSELYGMEAMGYQRGDNDPAEMIAGHVTFDFSSVTNYNTSGSSTVKAVKGDKKSLNTGRAVGEMNGVNISTDGRIYATYSNGQTKLLGQIASAQFANASGLSKEGDNLYSSTLNSGEATVQDITTDGGYMNTGVLEMSNVDLSREFTEMITTQRGFQANSRIITVSDTLLEELTNLKR